ncbi:hypothetical protein OPV22_012512 [Ensete ventricosum]|uniref:protein-serine/threonine phosphatase n=1 Tax=Ensete ventricosum TaxID=4639 RepID=A0AAV8R1R7_ENSVE|nr:hypothetical protein OPV22_012512 [Ensete ventricosum]
MKGEDCFVVRTDCLGVPGDPSSSSVFAEKCLQELPCALVAGFVKTNKQIPREGQTSGTTVTFVIVDGWASLLLQLGTRGPPSLLARGFMPIQINRGCGCRGNFIISLSDAGGKLIIASDGTWDASTSEMAANCCRGLLAELAAWRLITEIS